VEKRYEPADVLAIDKPLASHCWLRWTTDAGTPDAPTWGLEAIPPRVHVFDPATKAGQVIREYVVPTDAEGAWLCWRLAAPYDGRPYSALGVVATYLLLRFGLPDVFERLPHTSVFCSQLVLTLLRAVKVDPMPLFKTSNATPAALEAACAVAGWTPYDPGAARVEERAEHAD